jgi:hypothetical protein
MSGGGKIVSINQSRYFSVKIYIALKNTEGIKQNFLREREN